MYSGPSASVITLYAGVEVHITPRQSKQMHVIISTMCRDFALKLYFDSILTTVESLQAGFCRDLAARIASEIWVQTVSLDLF